MAAMLCLEVAHKLQVCLPLISMCCKLSSYGVNLCIRNVICVAMGLITVFCNRVAMELLSAYALYFIAIWLISMYYNLYLCYVFQAIPVFTAHTKAT